MKDAKAMIDAIPRFELDMFRMRTAGMGERERLIEAGKFLCSKWIMHWTGSDSEYLINMAYNRKIYGDTKKRAR